MGTGLCVFIALIAITIHRNRGMHRSLFASPYALWMMIFTIVPVILIAYYAFTDSSGAFTLDNFRSFWDSNYESNKIILDAMGEAGQAYISRGTVNVDTLVYSLWMAFQCTVICLLLGYPARNQARPDPRRAVHHPHVDELPPAHDCVDEPAGGQRAD